MKKLFFICLLFLFLLLLVGCQSETPTNEEPNEEMKEEIKAESIESKEAVSAIEKYYVFSNYDLTHSSSLSEGISFYESSNKEYVLGYGHQAHAIGIYQLFTIDEETQAVSKVREINEDFNFEAINTIRQLENWEEEMISYMIEHVETIDEIFFSYNSEKAEEEIVLNDNRLLLYPVSVGDNIHYFKQGQGLWAKYFASDSVIEFFGEPQFTVRSEID